MYSTFDVNFHCIVNGSVTAEVEALHDLTVKRFNNFRTAGPLLCCLLAAWQDECWEDSICVSGGGLLGVCEPHCGGSRGAEQLL